MSKISIIIPVYNAERYIEACLDSILNQTIQDIEIICVDDCSPDKSGDIIDSYALKDKRIRTLHHQVNTGPMIARTEGCELASGEYLFFCDSDDYLPKDALRILYDAAVTSGADITVGNMAFVNPHGHQTLIDRFNTIGDDWYSYLRSMLHWGSVSMCGSLFKRMLLVNGNLTSEHGLKQSEDRMVMNELLVSFQPTTAKVNEVVYYYRVNADSTSHQAHTDERVRCQFDALFRCYDYVDAHFPELKSDNDNFILRYMLHYIEMGTPPDLIANFNSHSQRLMKFSHMRNIIGLPLTLHLHACIKIPGYRHVMHGARKMIRRLQGKD